MITYKDAARIIIMDLEGGSKVITDSGGLTKYGVSQKAYPDLDIKNLSYEEAEAIFVKKYWLEVKAPLLPSPLNIYVVDMAYNAGPRTAMKLLQKALGNVAVDGRWGPRTQAAVMRYDVDELCVLFNSERVRSYVGMRNYDKYGAGWINRVFRLVGHVEDFKSRDIQEKLARSLTYLSEEQREKTMRRFR
jgi:lysozyme family protein